MTAIEVVVECPAIADAPQAILAYDPDDRLIGRTVSTPGLRTTATLGLPAPQFPLRIVVTGPRCTYVGTVTTPTERARIRLPEGTLTTAADDALSTLPCVDALQPWLGGRAVDHVLTALWGRCAAEDGAQDWIDDHWSTLPPSLLAWPPLYAPRPEVRTSALFEIVQDDPGHPAASYLRRRLEAAPDARPWRRVLDPCTCPDSRPTVEAGGAVLLQGLDSSVMEREEPPAVVICACDGRVLWEHR